MEICLYLLNLSSRHRPKFQTITSSSSLLPQKRLNKPAVSAVQWRHMHPKTG